MKLKDNTGRYQRQIKLSEFGRESQLKLLEARVIVVGAGGLGCPALQYLVGAGIGNVGIIDDDLVSISNLHRQVLYREADVGFSKAERAAKSLAQLNQDTLIDIYNTRLTNKNAIDILQKYDLIIDGTDNMASRYMINDACVLLKKPVIYGAISKFEGHVSVFNVKNHDGYERPVNYRDLFPRMPEEGEIPGCEEAGVLGVLPGIIGTMQANEAIKLITGIGKPLINKLLNYNALTNGIYEFEIPPRQDVLSLMPGTLRDYYETDYEWICSTQNKTEYEIDKTLFQNWLREKNMTVIDVRNPGESPEISGIDHLRIPLFELKDNIKSINTDRIVLVCQSGQRSLLGVKILSEIFGNTRDIYSLEGGILKWNEKYTYGE